MADHEFSFAIELSGRPANIDMLRELASRVLGQVGCGDHTVPAVVDALQTAVARSAAAGASTCRLRFVAHDGRLDIALSSGDGPLWRTSHNLA